MINLIPKCEAAIRTINKNFPTYSCRTNCFKYSFFPSTLNEWFRLDINIRNSESISLLKSRLLSFIRPNQSNIFNISDPTDLKLLTHLHLGLSHLHEHKFRHNFQDCLNPLCSCSFEIEDTTRYLLYCEHFSNHRNDLMNSVKSIIPSFETFTDNNRIDILLYGDSRFDENKNKIILEATINYLKISKISSGSLFEENFHYVMISPFKPIIL